MKAEPITSVLPPLYARWMDAFLQEEIPHETRATCDDCAMCAPPGEEGEEKVGGESIYFSPVTKCCTYQPKLANYLVGRALEDEDFAFSAGRKTLEKRIDDGVGVLPLGLAQSAMFDVLYQNGKDAFGLASALRCPHYLEEAGGRCGVWRHRNSICATWFCKHERGVLGLVFWHRMRDLLVAVEKSLSAWCVLESDLEPACLRALFPGLVNPRATPSLTAADIDQRADPETSARLWGHWRGREREFYRQCATRVTPLAWSDVAKIGGSEVAVPARIAQHAFAAMRSEEVPQRLTSAAFHVIGAGAEGVRVVGYSGSDPLDLDSAVLEILPFFDGRPTADVLKAIETKLHVRVEEDLVRRLADFEILTASKPRPA